MSETYEGKNILITGGAGFIGSNLAHRLVSLNANVTVVDALLPDYGGNLFNLQGIEDQIEFSTADIRNSHRMKELVKGQDYIFNLAGQISHVDSMTDPFTDAEINYMSQLKLLETCREHNPDTKIIYTGTRQVYGKPQELPIHESHPVNPIDVNGISKLAGEWAHIMYNNVHKLRTCSLRLTNTFGPRQLMKHNRQGFIPFFIKQAMKNGEIEIYEGDQLRDINYVEDVVDALLLAGKGDTEGKIYNLGHHEPVTLGQFTDTLIEVCGSGSYKFVPFPEEKKKIDVGSTYCDYSKIKDELGWEPKTSLEQGLEQTIDFYKKHGSHYY
jgi:UDP-glucose 4-epimerase